GSAPPRRRDRPSPRPQASLQAPPRGRADANDLPGIGRLRPPALAATIVPIQAEDVMKPTEQLHKLGQSIWLDNITRGLLTSGTLKRYIDELSVTGLTSNPTIFDQAIKKSSFYDEAIRAKAKGGQSDEELFFELAIEDLTQAADLFLAEHQRTNGVDGFVSLEVSPTLAYDTANTIKAARDLHARAKRPNLFIKIPGTPEGLPA